jgi:TRAP transporter TAXI family solute receptor
MFSSLAIGTIMTSAAAADRTAVSLATATPGGGFPVYGKALADAIMAVDPSFAIETRNTKGSTENVPLLENAAVDLALVQGEVAYEAMNGIGRPVTDLRVLTAMYSTAGMFVIKADAPYRSISDLKGLPIAFGAQGSGLVILARYVLDGLGLDQGRDFAAAFLERAGDGPILVEKGGVAALWGGGIGWPGFVAVTNRTGGGRFIVPDAGEITRIQAKHPFLKTLTVPAGTYSGQSAALTSVGSWSFVLARPSLDEAVAYRLAKAIDQARADLERRLPQASETTAENTVAAVSRVELLHPGVARYLRETGRLR